MLSVTERAIAVLKSVPVPEGAALRLVPSEDNKIELSMTTPSMDDELVWDGPDTVLRIASPLVDTLHGASLDVDAADNGSRLKLVLSRRVPLDGGGLAHDG